MNDAAVRRLLVVRRGGLGDTLLLLPVLRALRRAHPDAELHLAGVREFAAVLAAQGACDAARSSEELAAWSPELARARLRDYDLVCADDPALATAHGAVRTFEPRPRDASPLGRQLAAQLDLPLQWPEDAWLRRERGCPPDADVWLAPGSGGAAKCWPRPCWLTLAATLPRPPHVVVGPTERERDDPRRWPWPAGTGFVVEAEPVRLAARLSTEPSAFVGNDSGPTHLAAMLAVPTVALFGPSDARVFAPQGPRVQVLEAGGALAGLEPAAVLAGLRRATV